MAYRDDREALRARVENLQQELEAAKGGGEEILLFPKKTPQQRRARAARLGGALVVVAVVGVGVREWSSRAADRDINAAWGHLSTCLVGEPLAAGESAVARARRIQLGYASQPRGAAERWPARCQTPAHQLYQRLRENGRAEKDTRDAAFLAEDLAAKIEHGIADDDLVALLEPLWKQAQIAGLAAVASATDTPAPAPASPLHLAELAGAAVTSVDVPATSLYVEALPGVDRHVLIDAPQVDPAVLCTVAAQAETVRCRPLPGELGRRHGLRLSGTTDAGAAPLVFAGRDGADGIFRSDTGELVASVRAYSAYAGAGGYVAIQSWPDANDGHFELHEQRQAGGEITRVTVKPEAQRATQPVTSIHRSRLLWDKALLQLLDGRNLDRSPWVAYRSLPTEGGGGVYHRIGDLNWINTTITGCRGAKGIVARFGPGDAMLLFNEGDRWQGPLAARGLGELRCDGADAVFLSSWPLRVKRCTPAGCDEQTNDAGNWPTMPTRGQSVSDFTDGKPVVAWATDRLGVRFRSASAAQLGNASDVVVFDDLVNAAGELTRTSVVSGMRLVAAGRGAVLFLATTAGIRAIRLGTDGTFSPAKITP
jgi:hypothetical protein